MTLETRLMDVAPVHPPAPYIGGKRRLASRLVAAITAVDHLTYCEPFVGMGGIFFRRTKRPVSEVINDRNGEVATLFRILQRHYPQFMDTLRFQLSGRREFDRLRASDPATLTDLERAGRFLYLQRLAFGGKVAGQTFGVDPRSGGGFNLNRLAPVLDAIHDRLAGVVIENLDWEAFVDRYDRPSTLFYLDPPYLGSEQVYGPGMFGPEQFERLASRLGRLHGHFILSINDTPDMHEVFKAFAIEPVHLRYTVGGGKGIEVKELIVSGTRRLGGGPGATKLRRNAGQRRR